MREYDTIIIGGGLAGLSCARHLVDAGQKILLLEASSVIGGRTSSWKEDGMPVESGLHRFLGFYSLLPDLMEWAGINVNQAICWEDEIEIRMPDGGPSAVFALSPLHKPLKTIGKALDESGFLTVGDKLKLSKFFAAGLKNMATDQAKLDKLTVTEYARHHDLDDKLIDRALRPATEGLFFLPPEEYSAFALFGLIAAGIPKLPKTRVGAFAGGMSEVMSQPIARAIEAKGGEIRTKSSVKKLVIKEQRVIGVKLGIKTIKARQVVVATGIQPAQQLLKPFAGQAWCDKLLRLPTMASVTFQMELSSPSMELDRATFGPTTALAAFSEQSRTTFKQTDGRLSIIMSEKYLKTPPEALYKIVVNDARRLGIDLSGKMQRYRKVAWPADFYRLSPGSEALKPTQKTSVNGLFLAGDYTKQKWLTTMEGAVLSGQLAAHAALAKRS